MLHFTYCLISYLTLSQSHSNFQYTDSLMHTAYIYSHMHKFQYISITVVALNISTVFWHPQNILISNSCESHINYTYVCMYVCIYRYSSPLQAWSGPEGSRSLRFPDFMTTAQDGGKVISLAYWPPLPQKMLLVLISVRGWVDPRATVRSEGFYVNEKSTDTSWDRTCYLPVCSTAT